MENELTTLRAQLDDSREQTEAFKQEAESLRNATFELLKRLEAAEAVCEAIRGTSIEIGYARISSTWKAWESLKPQGGHGGH